MRTLRAYAQAITEAIGDGLASALRHVIGWLLMGAKAVLTMANAFRAFMQTLFGKNISGATLGLTDDLGESSDYAQDLDDGATGAADSLDDASDSAQQLKKDLSVLPFDELNQLNKDRESTGSSSGSPSGGVGGIGGMGDITDGLFDLTTDAFRDSALPDVINEWAQRIRDAFESQDWVRLGQEIASGINDGVHALYEILDPEKVKEKVDPFIDAFTTTFNSFIDALDFEGIGKLLGRGLNDLLYIINSTLEKINWINLGKQLGRGLNGLVTELDFAAVGRLFANRINVIWETAWGFVTTFNWAELGENLATGAWEFVSHIDYDAIIGTFNEGLGGLADTVFTFASNFPWAETGSLWAQKANLLISGFPAEKIGSALATALNGITELFDNLLDPAKGGIDFYELGSKLAEGANSLFEKPDGIDFDRLGSVLANGLNVLPRAVAGFVENFGWSDFGKRLAEGAWSFIESIHFDALQRAVNGGLRGIATAVTDFASHFPWQEAGNLIAGHVNDFIDNFPAEQIGTAVGTLLDGIVDLVLSITDPEKGINFGQLGNKLGTGFKQMILTGIKPNAIGNLITNLWSQAWSLLGGFIEGLRNEDGSGTSIGTAIKETLEYIVEKISFGSSNEALGTFVNNILEDIEDIFGDTKVWEGLGKKIGGGIADLLSSIHADDLGRAISSMASAFGTFIGSAVGELWNRRGEIGAKFEELFENVEWADVLSAVGLIVAPIMAAKIGEWILANVVKEIVKMNLISLLTGGVSGAVTNAGIANAFTGMFDGLTSSFAPAEEAVEGGLGAISTSVGEVAAAFAEGGALLSAIAIASQKVAEFYDLLRGGNGELTMEGGAVDSFTNKLAGLLVITPEVKDEIFSLKEAYENEEITEDEFANGLVEALTNAGVGAGYAQSVVESLRDGIGHLNEDQIAWLLELTSRIPETSEASATALEGIGTTGQEVFRNLRNGLFDYASQSDDMTLQQAMALQELLDSYGGFKTDSVAALNAVLEQWETMGGEPEVIKNAIISSLGEDVYNGLITATDNATSKTGELESAVNELDTGAETAGTNTASLSDMIKSFADLGLSQPVLIALLSGAIALLGTNSGTSEDKIDSLQKALDNYDSDPTTENLNELAKAFEDTGISSEDLAKALTTSMMTANSDVKREAGAIINEITNMGESLKTEGETAGGNIDSGLVSGMTDNKQDVVDAAGEVADSIPDTLKDSEHLDSNSPSETTKEIGRDVTIGLAEGILDAEQNLTDAITNLVNNFTENTSGLFTTLAETFKGYGTDIINGFSDGISNAFANISVYGYVTDIATEFTNAINQNYYSLYYAGQSLGTAFANGVSSIHIPVPWLYVNYWDKYTNSDGSWYTVPRYGVNWYAKGGLFTSPTIAGFGEAGDEAALPLENKRVMSRIADAIIDNSGGMGMTSEQMSSAVARGMVQAMMSNQSNQNQVFNITVKTESDETLARAVIRGMDAIDYRENASPRFSY